MRRRCEQQGEEDAEAALNAQRPADDAPDAHAVEEGDADDTLHNGQMALFGSNVG